MIFVSKSEIKKQFIHLFIAFAMSPNALSPSWVDTDLYPFKHHYATLSAGTMHYVDEGQGEVLLFVHGTPTWSFLYRDFIKTLSERYRCIAIDHLGFGLSEKRDTARGTPEWHTQNLSAFIEKMDLQIITLCVHDFGGPIGLAAGLQQVERIQKVVLFNTWLWATKQEKAVQKIDKLISGWLGRFLYLTMNFSPKVLLKQGFADSKKLSRQVHRQYLHPFPNKKTRMPLLHLAQALAGSSDWYQQQWEQLEPLAQKEWLILWGNQDGFITPAYLQKWQQRLPHAQVQTFECGHFVQEEATEASIEAIGDFVGH